MDNIVSQLPEGVSGKTILIAGGSDQAGQEITLSLGQMGASLIARGADILISNNMFTFL